MNDAHPRDRAAGETAGGTPAQLTRPQQLGLLLLAGALVLAVLFRLAGVL